MLEVEEGCNSLDVLSFVLVGELVACVGLAWILVEPESDIEGLPGLEIGIETEPGVVVLLVAPFKVCPDVTDAGGATIVSVELLPKFVGEKSIVPASAMYSPGSNIPVLLNITSPPAGFLTAVCTSIILAVGSISLKRTRKRGVGGELSRTQ